MTTVVCSSGGRQAIELVAVLLQRSRLPRGDQHVGVSIGSVVCYALSVANPRAALMDLQRILRGNSVWLRLKALRLRLQTAANLFFGAGPLAAHDILPWRAFVERHGSPQTACYALTYHSKTRETEEVELTDDAAQAAEALCNSCALPPLLHGTGDCVDGAHESSFPLQAIKRTLKTGNELVVLSTFPLPVDVGKLSYDKEHSAYVDCKVPSNVLDRLRVSGRWAHFSDVMHVLAICKAAKLGNNSDTITFTWQPVSSTEYKTDKVTFIFPTVWQKLSMIDPRAARAATKAQTFKAWLAARARARGV